MKLILPVYAPDSARDAGYQSITVDINSGSETHIMESMQRRLASCDACWIRISAGIYQAARKRQELRYSKGNYTYLSAIAV